MKRLRFPGTLVFSLSMMVIGFGAGAVTYAFYVMNDSENFSDSGMFVWLLASIAFASIGIVLLLIWLGLSIFAVSKVGKKAVDRIETQQINLGKRKK